MLRARNLGRGGFIRGEVALGSGPSMQGSIGQQTGEAEADGLVSGSYFPDFTRQGRIDWRCMLAIALGSEAPMAGWRHKGRLAIDSALRPRR